jgi:hypothetical protein
MAETRAEIEARIKNQARRAFKKEAPPEGKHQFVVTGTSLLDQPSKGDKDGNGAGCRTLAIRVAPLGVENDLGTVQSAYETTIWATIPLVNEEIEGHTVDGTTTSKFTAQMSAMVPARVPYVPAKLADGSWDNTPQTKAARTNAQIEASVLATEILDGTFKLDDQTFYGTTKNAPADKGGYYVNGLSSELKPGEKLVGFDSKD